MTDRKQPPEVNVNINQPTQVPPRHVIEAHYMACRNCGAKMVRGTQCPRCKAWCR